MWTQRTAALLEQEPGAMTTNPEVHRQIANLQVGDKVELGIDSRDRMGRVKTRTVKSEVLGVSRDYHGRPVLQMKSRAKGGAQLAIPLGGFGSAAYAWSQGNARRPVSSIRVLGSRQTGLERREKMGSWMEHVEGLLAEQYEFGGESFRTAVDAAEAWAYEWATAGGMNSLEDALEGLTGNPKMVVREIRKDWPLPDEVDQDDAIEGVKRARKALEKEIGGDENAAYWHRR